MVEKEAGPFTRLYQVGFRPLKELSRSELEDELTSFRNLWTWIDESAKAWLCHIRYHTKLVRRDYSVLKGFLGAPHFKVESVDIDVESEDFDYLNNLKTWEYKTVTIPISQLIDFEFIHNQIEEPIKVETSQDVEKAELEV